MACASHATVLVDNLDNHFEALGAVVGNLDGLQFVAGEFITGDGDYITINQVTLHVGGKTGDPYGFTVGLYDAIDGLPGNLIAEFSGNTDPILDADHVYTADGDILLSANTSYFIVAEASTPEATPPEEDPTAFYVWDMTTVNSQTAVGSWSIPDRIYFYNGTEWEADSGGAAPRFSVEGIPEPEQYAVAFGACALLLAWRRRSAS